MRVERRVRLALEAVEAKRVARAVALEVRRFVAERYPEMVPGLAVASDDALWMRYRGELVAHEEASRG